MEKNVASMRAKTPHLSTNSYQDSPPPFRNPVSAPSYLPDSLLDRSDLGMGDLNVLVWYESAHKWALESADYSNDYSTDPAKIGVWVWAFRVGPMPKDFYLKWYYEK